MTKLFRGKLFKALALGAASAPLAKAAHADTQSTFAAPEPRWGKGIEGQRKTDLGDNHYLNPIVAGDHPAPTVLKDGDDYYMTFTPFTASPGVVNWHSTNLLAWTPVATALHKPMGNVFAVKIRASSAALIPRTWSAKTASATCSSMASAWSA